MLKCVGEGEERGCPAIQSGCTTWSGFKLFEIPLGEGGRAHKFSPLHSACSNVDIALLLLLRPTMALPHEARQKWVFPAS